MTLRTLSGLLLLFSDLLCLTNCTNDNRDDCPPAGQDDQGAEISFFSRTPCQQENSYPESITDLTVLVFDRYGILEAHFDRTETSLTGNYTEAVELPTGLYSVSAWSGLDAAPFDRYRTEDGTTSGTDTLLRIRREDGVAESLSGIRLWYGEGGAFYVEPDASESGYVSAGVNLLEVTNRITVSVEGLPPGGNYEVFAEADNGTMTLAGEVAADDVLRYEWKVSSVTPVLEGEITLLKLETGHTYTLVIRDTEAGTDLFRESLLGTLILKNPDVNLNCDHDFTIRFTAEDQCACGTYTITQVWVNNWLVHSYGTWF